ncbi:MAG: Mur ligase family protein, partial [Candidatus Thermoplasmatota archaeon]
MRTQLQYLLRRLLRLLARAVVKKYAPFVVGVTGSVGKSSTKEAIAAVLRADRPVRASGGNLNNEFGLPLAVIGDYDHVG